MTHGCTCKTCGKNFQSRKDSTICYGCALKHFAGDGFPEEGDFNSALLTSGEITDQEERDLMEDLRSVEEGRSIREPYHNDAEEDYIDPAWCYVCNRDTAFCKCICHECDEDIEDCQCSE